MITAHRSQQRHNAIADIGALCAAAVEAAGAGVRIDWARRIAVEARPRRPPTSGVRNGTDKRSRVGVAWVGEQRLGRTDLHNLPQIHDRGWSTAEAAAAILDLATERMVGAIEDVTVSRGVDPVGAVLVGGGGSAGFNVVAIARRLGCGRIVIPSTGATLSAAGALLSDLTAEFRALLPTLSTRFSSEAVERVLADLRRRCEAFAAGPGAGSVGVNIFFSVEARYLGQAWDIKVPLPENPSFDAEAVEALVARFHKTHDELFAVSDPAAVIEFLTWGARVECKINADDTVAPAFRFDEERKRTERLAYFSGHGWLEAAVRDFSALRSPLAGPAIVESPFTTVVLPPGCSAVSSRAGGLVIDLNRASAGP
jgi:N-methylhydantoinase A